MIYYMLFQSEDIWTYYIEVYEISVEQLKIGRVRGMTNVNALIIIQQGNHAEGVVENHGCLIHIFRQIIQKTEENYQLLYMVFVNNEKTFDSLTYWSVLDSLQPCHIDWRHIEILITEVYV